MVWITGRGSQRVGTTIPDRIDNSLENFGRPGSFIDHGRGFGEAATAPFKHQKGSLDEGGLRAAAFVHYPAAVEAGDVSNAFMTMMDFLPTFLEIAGTEHPGAGPYRDDREINGHRWPVGLATSNSTVVDYPFTDGLRGLGKRRWWRSYPRQLQDHQPASSRRHGLYTLAPLRPGR